MWKIAASRKQVLHYQTSTDEMAQHDDKHIYGGRTNVRVTTLGTELSLVAEKDASVQLK